MTGNTIVDVARTGWDYRSNWEKRRTLKRLNFGEIFSECDFNDLPVELKIILIEETQNATN